MFFGVSRCTLVFLLYWRQMDVFWASHRTFILCTLIYYHFYYISILFFFIPWWKLLVNQKLMCLIYQPLQCYKSIMSSVLDKIFREAGSSLKKKIFWNMFLLFLIIKHTKFEVKWMLLSVSCIKGSKQNWKSHQSTAKFFLLRGPVLQQSNITLKYLISIVK